MYAAGEVFKPPLGLWDTKVIRKGLTKKETPEVAERTKETASIRRASEASHKTRVLVADEHTMFSEVLGGGDGFLRR